MRRESLAAHQDVGGKMSDVQQKATREEIEKRAYRLFEERGCRDGGGSSVNVANFTEPVLDGLDDGADLALNLG
jgi:hypothetical protein